MITLQPVNEDNFLAVCALKAGEEQKDFVLPAPMILARAYAYREQRASAYAVCTSEAVVGVMLVENMDDEPACYHISELLIDKAHQKKGYARETMRLLLCKLQKEGKYPCVELCVKKANSVAIRLYTSLGFAYSGYNDPEAPDCAWCAHCDGLLQTA